MRLTICGMRPSAPWRFYWRRLRKYPGQELFATAGIAVGVALVFAVLIANTSIAGSAEQLVHGITGSAQLQLAARTGNGFDERIERRVERVRGVTRTAPLLRVRLALRGPRGTQSVELLGGTASLGELGGKLMRDFGQRGLRLAAGVALPRDVATALGVDSGDRIRLLAGGRVRQVTVGAVLGPEIIGPIAHSRTVLAPLQLAQDLANRPGRLSQLIVATRPDAATVVQRRLERLAGGRVTVEPADAELRLLRQASQPNDQSTTLFAAISAMVGFLFAFNSILVTTAERRRFIADLRIQGFGPRQLVLIVGFEALMLGVTASALGLVLGDLLSRAVFDDVPEYLTFAFPIGGQRVIEPTTVALSFGVGVLAALLASLRPLLDLRARRPLDAVFHEGGEPGEAVSPRTRRGLLAAAVTLVGAVTLMVLIDPDTTILGALGLALATALVMPAVFVVAARGLARLSRRSHHANLLGFAMGQLENTRTRSITLAAVGALAIYGSVAIGGAHADLLRGLDQHFKEHVGNADLWVRSAGDTLTTGSFRAGAREAEIARVPGVVGVRSYRGGLFDVHGRRVYVTGKPATDRALIPRSQVIEGNAERADALVRAGAWAAVSAELARSLGAGIGDWIALPAARGETRFRIAALTTNLGWPPGTVIVNADDYARTWRSGDPTAFEVDLAPGTGQRAGRRAVAAALGPSSGLVVETQQQRIDDYRRAERQGLARLSQISLLLLLAAALAMACAMGATVWERRRRFAAYKIQGFGVAQLWRTLLWETGFVVAIGCLVGAIFGTYGHFLAGRYLEQTTGFPAPFAFGGAQLLLTLALVAGTAYVVTALPGYAAARTPMSAAFEGGS
jgi:putative ABC transport system permease protein